jgi:hypothetical protein
MMSVDVPAPIMAVKGPDGAWRGKGYLDTYWRVTSYESQVIESGPIFTDVRVTYRFEQNKSYVVNIRLISKQDWALVGEQMDLGPRNKFIFDCSVGFKPNQLAMLTPGAQALTRDLNFFDDILQARMAIFTQYTQLADFRDALGVCESGPSRDFVGIFQYQPGHWSRPKVNFVEFWEHRQQGDNFLTREPLTTMGKADAFPNPDMPAFQGKSVYEGHFTWEFQLIDGHRQWCLTVVDKAAQFPKQGAARLRNQYVQVGNCPLDMVKDLVLDWDEGTLPPHHEAPPPAAPDAGGKKRQDLLAYLGGFVEGFYYREGWGRINPVSIRGVAPSCSQFDKDRADGRYTPAQDKLIRAYYAFLAYMLHDQNAYPWDKTMLPVNDPESTEPLYAGMANQNFNTDRYNLVGRVGLSLRHHLQSKVWTDHFLQQLDAQLGFYLYPESGCWEESVTYANHILSTILPTMRKFRTDLNVNLCKDQRLARMYDFFVQTLTPYNPVFKSAIIPGCGDHGEGNGYRENYLKAAEEFNTVDPKFASRLMWAYRQMGGTTESAVQPEPQDLKSVFLQGFGAVLRANDRDGNQTYLILRTGESWGHHHQDDNSLHLYAKGVPLISDAGKGAPVGPAEWKYDAKGHSRVSLTNISTINYLGKAHRGWIKQHYFSDSVDYLLGYTPFLDATTARKDGNPALFTPIHPGWNDRQILFVRPEYFLIRDTVHTDLYGEEFYLHMDDMKSVNQEGNCVTATSEFGPQMDVVMIQPSKVTFETGGHKAIEHMNKVPSSTSYIHLSQKPNTDFLFLLYPRKTDQAKAKVEPLAKNAGVKVTHDGATDYLFLNHEAIVFKDGDIEFRGNVGVIRLEGGKATLSLPDGEMIRYKDQTVTR